MFGCKTALLFLLLARFAREPRALPELRCICHCVRKCVVYSGVVYPAPLYNRNTTEAV